MPCVVVSLVVASGCASLSMKALISRLHLYHLFFLPNLIFLDIDINLKAVEFKASASDLCLNDAMWPKTIGAYTRFL